MANHSCTLVLLDHPGGYDDPRGQQCQSFIEIILGNNVDLLFHLVEHIAGRHAIDSEYILSPQDVDTWKDETQNLYRAPRFWVEWLMDLCNYSGGLPQTHPRTGETLFGRKPTHPVVFPPDPDGVQVLYSEGGLNPWNFKETNLRGFFLSKQTKYVKLVVSLNPALLALKAGNGCHFTKGPSGRPIPRAFCSPRFHVGNPPSDDQVRRIIQQVLSGDPKLLPKEKIVAVPYKVVNPADVSGIDVHQLPGRKKEVFDLRSMMPNDGSRISFRPPHEPNGKLVVVPPTPPSMWFCFRNLASHPCGFHEEEPTTVDFWDFFHLDPRLEILPPHIHATLCQAWMDLRISRIFSGGAEEGFRKLFQALSNEFTGRPSDCKEMVLQTRMLYRASVGFLSNLAPVRGQATMAAAVCLAHHVWPDGSEIEGEIDFSWMASPVEVELILPVKVDDLAAEDGFPVEPEFPASFAKKCRELSRQPNET